MEESTPRSLYGSPRDDRFYTPRTVARENSAHSSVSDEWHSPRFESPRFGTPRVTSSGTPRSSDGTPREGDFQTPRTSRTNNINNNQFDADRRGELSARSNRSYDDPFVYGAGSKQQQPPVAKNNGISSRQDHPSYYSNQSHVQAQAKYSSGGGNSVGFSEKGGVHNGYNAYNNSGSIADSKDQPYQMELPQNILNGHQSNEDVDYIALDLAASGLSDQDVEDVFSYARHGRVEEIDRLFNKGLPVDVRDQYGNTVLTIACQNGNKRVAKAVLRRGANINVRNHKGNTPLHYCYHYGYGESLGQYIVSKGADADARNNAGKFVYDGI